MAAIDLKVCLAVGIESVQLMTNNPFKIRQLTDLGVKVTSIMPSIVQPNPYNEGYLR
jgi:GTP cyclohydrolase II